MGPGLRRFVSDDRPSQMDSTSTMARFAHPSILFPTNLVLCESVPTSKIQLGLDLASPFTVTELCSNVVLSHPWYACNKPCPTDTSEEIVLSRTTLLSES